MVESLWIPKVVIFELNLFQMSLISTKKTITLKKRTKSFRTWKKSSELGCSSFLWVLSNIITIDRIYEKSKYFFVFLFSVVNLDHLKWEVTADRYRMTIWNIEIKHVPPKSIKSLHTSYWITKIVIVHLIKLSLQFFTYCSFLFLFFNFRSALK